MGIEVFHDPSSVEEAVRLMGESAGAARYLAGGTDLLCEAEPPEAVIHVGPLLRHRRKEGDEFVIGAGVTVSSVAAWEELARADGGLLRSVARDFASWQIRNMATIGGNLASAAPSADFAPPLLVLEGRAILAGKGGERREVPLDRFFTAPHESVAGDDLLVEIRFAEPPPGARFAWAKIGRNEGDIAVASAAASLDLREGICRRARIALGAVAPTPIRVGEAEDLLRGAEPSKERIAAAARIAGAAARPIDDQRASAAYRRHMCAVLVRRVLAAAAGEA